MISPIRSWNGTSGIVIHKFTKDSANDCVAISVEFIELNRHNILKDIL